MIDLPTITAQQFVILRGLIVNGDSMRSADLADLIGLPGKANSARFYQLLSRMADSGLIVSQTSQHRTTVSITNAGLIAFTETKAFYNS